MKKVKKKRSLKRVFKGSLRLLNVFSIEHLWGQLKGQLKGQKLLLLRSSDFLLLYIKMPEIGEKS